MLTVRGHTFIPFPLNERSIVVDLGANTGEFSQMILDRFRCHCIAVEPNPRLVKVEEAPKLTFVWGAIANEEGWADLHLDDNDEASTILADGTGKKVRVPTFTLAGLMKQVKVTHVDLLKVDIEGCEFQMIMSTPREVLESVDQITMEFHDFCGLITPEQMSSMRSRLRSAGFDEIKFGPQNMNWLFVRRGAVGIGNVRRAYLICFIGPARNLLHFNELWEQAKRASQSRRITPSEGPGPRDKGKVGSSFSVTLSAIGPILDKISVPATAECLDRTNVPSVFH
jgi:FkbM family methyltransferase